MGAKGKEPMFPAEEIQLGSSNITGQVGSIKGI